MDIDIIQITLVAARVALHVGVPADKADDVEQKLLDGGLADGVTQNETGWGGDEEVVHLVIEVYAFCVVDLVQSMTFQELLQGGSMVPNEDGNVLQITDGSDWNGKLLELPSEAITV
jgi:hypothetical protein